MRCTTSARVRLQRFHLRSCAQQSLLTLTFAISAICLSSLAISSVRNLLRSYDA